MADCISGKKIDFIENIGNIQYSGARQTKTIKIGKKEEALFRS